MLGTIVAEIAIVLCVAAGAVGAHFLVQRRADYRRFSSHNDVAGFLISVVGIVYAVLLGFVIVVVWERYTATQNVVNGEVAAVADVYRIAAAFPAPLRLKVRSQLAEYIGVVVRDEWPQMDGSNVPSVAPVLEAAAHEIDLFQPGNVGQGDAHEAAMAALQRLFDARHQRLSAVEPSVLPVLWTALIAGAIVTLGFAYLFGTENRGAQLLMTAALAGIMAVLFVVIYEFDTPFGGAVAVSDVQWTTLQQRLPSIP